MMNLGETESFSELFLGLNIKVIFVKGKVKVSAACVSLCACVRACMYVCVCLCARGNLNQMHFKEPGLLRVPLYMHTRQQYC